MELKTELISRLTCSHNAMMMTDPCGNILYVNDLFCYMTGYSRQELIGKNPRILSSGYHKKDFFQSLYNTILSGNPWSGEICNRNKAGKLYWVRVSIQPQINEDHAVVAFIALQTEITQQFEAEQKASTLKVHLDALFEHAPVGLMVLDSDFNTLQTNPHANEILFRDSGYEIPWHRINDCEDVRKHLKHCAAHEGTLTIRVNLALPTEEQDWIVRGITEPNSAQRSLLVILYDSTVKNQMIRQLLFLTEERQLHLGQRLHDTLGQTLAGLGLKFDLLCRELLPKIPEYTARLQDFRKTLLATTQLTRNLASEYCAYHIYDGLEASVNLVLQEAQKIRPFTIQKSGTSLLESLPLDHWLPIYRIIREGIINAVLHSQCNQIIIDIKRTYTRLCVIVQDDGIGIDQSTHQEHLGLKLARMRAELIGATLNYDNVVGGFRLSLSLCLPQDSGK